MASSFISKLNHALRSKKYVRFILHHENEIYDGFVLLCNKDMVLIQEDRDFFSDGIIALPIRSIKRLRIGPIEKLRGKIVKQYGILKKIKKSFWLLKTKNIEQIIRECRLRKIWPIVEALKKGESALFIGPITEVGKNEFYLYAYDAEGKWEKNYKLQFREVFRIQLFDAYSKYFNRYMKRKIKAN